jgi:threonine dehydrogenase-like Zn-dependent dehydrogenase
MGRYQSEAFVYLGRPGAVERQTLKLECGPTDLLLEVAMCARCGTDKTIYRHGHPNVDPFAPVVLGHELVGRVVEVGAKVSTLTRGIGYRDGDTLPASYLNFQPGERVVCQSRIARYRDGLMLIPKPIANLSFQIHGGYARYMRVPESMIRSESVLRVPEHVTDEEACLVEPAACALESIFATPHQVGVDDEGRHLFRAGIQPGGKTCVIGSGTVSMIYATLALLEGAGQVIMIARSEAKAELINSVLGKRIQVYLAPRTGEDATPETLAAEERVVRDLEDWTGGYLFDDVVSACASPAAQRLMLKLYTREGYAVGACFGGTHQLVDAADIDVNHYRAAKTMGTSGCSTDCMKTILRWLGEDRLSLEGFLSKRLFTLEDDPHEFFTTGADGLKPALYMREPGS